MKYSSMFSKMIVFTKWLSWQLMIFELRVAFANAWWNGTGIRSVWYDLEKLNIEQKSLVYQPLVPQHKIQGSLTRKCCWSWSTLVEVILGVSQFRGHYDPASLWRGTWNCMHRLCEQYIVLIFPVLIFWSKLKEESMKFFARTVSMDNNPRGS